MKTLKDIISKAHELGLTDDEELDLELSLADWFGISEAKGKIEVLCNVRQLMMDYARLLFTYESPEDKEETNKADA